MTTDAAAEMQRLIGKKRGPERLNVFGLAENIEPQSAIFFNLPVPRPFELEPPGAGRSESISKRGLGALLSRLDMGRLFMLHDWKSAERRKRSSIAVAFPFDTHAITAQPPCQPPWQSTAPGTRGVASRLQWTRSSCICLSLLICSLQ